MHGIVSLLNEDIYKQVKTIWHELENKCGLTGIKVTPDPHFSWQIAKDYNWSELETVLKEISAESHPFIVHAVGLAIFSGPSPVVYIPVVRTLEISAYHSQLWSRLQPISSRIGSLYAPSN